MRDRLIELIIDAENEICMEKPYFSNTERIERVADHLLAEGVIVPPCKVGQKLYLLGSNIYGEKDIYETTEWSFVYDEEGLSVEAIDVSFCSNYNYVFGKTVFCTRAEAERAMAERSNENGE